MHILLYSPTQWSVPDTLFDARKNSLTRMTGTLSELDDNVISADADVIFLHGFENNALLIAKITHLCNVLPNVAVIPSCLNPDPDFLLKLMRSGVREVLTQETASAVRETLDRAIANRQQSTGVSPSGQLAHTIALVSSKGGDGATFLAANLAFSLAADPACRVLAIDLSLPFGDLDIFLTGEKIQNNLAKFSQEIDRLDGALLESMVHHITGNLHLVPSPSVFEDSFQINPANVQKLVQVASGFYQYIVLDLGTQIGPFGMNFLDGLGDLVLVATRTMPSIRHTSQILRLLDGLGFDSNKVSLVLNRYQERGDLNLAQIRKAVAKDISHTFPDEFDAVEEAILNGTALVQSRPKSRLARAISEWTSHWAGVNPNKEHSIWRLLKIR